MNTTKIRPLWTSAFLADVDDPRRLYRRVTDDIATLILDGTLPADTRLPSARELAEIYGVSTMTAQRAMHELQQCRFTYAITGKGTFVHPEARTVAVLLHAMRHPRVARDITEYLRQQQDLVDPQAVTGSGRQRARIGCALLDHAVANQPLLDYLRQLWPDPPDAEHQVLRLW